MKVAFLGFNKPFQLVNIVWVSLKSGLTPQQDIKILYTNYDVGCWYNYSVIIGVVLCLPPALNPDQAQIQLLSLLLLVLLLVLGLLLFALIKHTVLLFLTNCHDILNRLFIPTPITILYHDKPLTQLIYSERFYNFFHSTFLCSTAILNIAPCFQPIYVKSIVRSHLGLRECIHHKDLL